MHCLLNNPSYTHAINYCLIKLKQLPTRAELASYVHSVLAIYIGLHEVANYAGINFSIM